MPEEGGSVYINAWCVPLNSRLSHKDFIVDWLVSFFFAEGKSEQRLDALISFLRTFRRHI
jgi:hypothetical protein